MEAKDLPSQSRITVRTDLVPKDDDLVLARAEGLWAVRRFKSGLLVAEGVDGSFRSARPVGEELVLGVVVERAVRQRV